jgi:purine-binding chemotaxis protein CheW
MESTNLQTDKTTPVRKNGPAQRMVFALGSQEYAIDPYIVENVIPYQQPLPLPGAPNCVTGIINYNSEITPIIDLRHCFGLAALIAKETELIIIHWEHLLIGFVVDRTRGLVTFTPDNLQPFSSDSGERGWQCVRKLLEREQRHIYFFDPEIMLSQGPIV